MNIYSYSRTSTLEHIYTERDSELSLETELLAIQTYCLQRNWYLSETLRDKEIDWGVQFKDRENLNVAKQWFAENTNPENFQGKLGEAIKGADMFLGLSGPGVVTPEEIASMAEDAIVFALANVTALSADASGVATADELAPVTAFAPLNAT